MAPSRFHLEFYKDASGRPPVLEWLRDEVSVATRRVVGTALRQILQEQGVGVCGTSFGRQLGGGVFEFRLRERDLLLPVFCHAYGDKVVLILAAYDKSEDSPVKRQNAEIALARRRLDDWQKRQKQS
jgi:phage-related protein